MDNPKQDDVPESSRETDTAGGEAKTSRVRTLRELIDTISGRQLSQPATDDSGLAEVLPFPFLAIVDQTEMKLALLLSLVNPEVGGVLLIGPRGTGKTTAVRGLVDLLPEVPRSLCYYGCMPEDIETGGLDAVCTACAQKYARGEPLAAMDKVRLVELPLNARLDDVVGHVEALIECSERPIFRKGILAQADRNLLHVDEVNLLSDDVVDAILDAAAQGVYHIRRGPVAATYRARFVLIGSMNPEEGNLRPQILDRFGLRVVVRGLVDTQQRLEAYQRVRTYREWPRLVTREYADITSTARSEIQSARNLLQGVILPAEVSKIGLEIIHQLQIDSLRAEITWFEAARAYSALDARHEVSVNDLLAVAPIALRMRRSEYMVKFKSEMTLEEDEISSIINTIIH